jgi:hypothetical protein
MSKRSTRIAKRDEFENALKEVEEKIRSRRGKNPAAVAPAERHPSTSLRAGSKLKS